MGGLGSRSVDFRTSEMERSDGWKNPLSGTGRTLVSGEGYYMGGERVEYAVEGLLLLVGMLFHCQSSMSFLISRSLFLWWWFMDLGLVMAYRGQPQ